MPYDFRKEAAAHDARVRDKGGSTEPAASNGQDADGLVTEDSVALGFASAHANELRFDHDDGAWFRWTGVAWRRETTKLAYSYARKLARADDSAHLRLPSCGGGDARAGGASAGGIGWLVTIKVGNRLITADLNGKSVRKGRAFVKEHGADAAIALLQGKLVDGDVLAEAGLAVQPKVPSTRPSQAAS